MGDMPDWEIDRIAATKLIALIKEAPEEHWGRLTAEAFSQARIQNYDWAAKRVHETALKLLETCATDEFRRRDASWTDGYRYAEEYLSSQAPSELLGVDVRSPMTKGQVLRSLLRLKKMQS
jgi:hypothetical protein